MFHERSSPPRDVQVQDIRSHVASHFGVTEEELLARSRQSEFVNRRAICYQLCREMSDASLSQIGRYMANRDHTTIIAGLKRKLPLEMQIAKNHIRFALEQGSPHSLTFVRAAPFQTRRAKSEPVFRSRRGTGE